MCYMLIFVYFIYLIVVKIIIRNVVLGLVYGLVLEDFYVME